MSTRGLLLAEATVTDAPSGLLPLLGHTMHWTLTYGTLAALVWLLVAARPRRAAAVRRPLDVRQRQLALLRSAHTHPAERAVATTAGTTAGSTAGSTTAPATDAAVATWLPVAVVSSAAAAGVHAAAGPQHFAEGLLVGGFFVVSALAQLGWAAAVMLIGPRRWLLRAALVGNAAVVVLWLLSRSIGLPGAGAGPGEADPVGPWDLAATAWEATVIWGVSLVLGSASFRDVGASGVDIVRWSAAARAWLLVSVALLAVLTVAGTSG